MGIREPVPWRDVGRRRVRPAAPAGGTKSGADELANTLTINEAFTLNGGDLTLTTNDVTVAPGFLATINSTFRGTGLDKLGGGTLLLGAAAGNTFAGPVTVQAGTLRFSNVNQLNLGVASNTLAVGTASGVATLDYTGNPASVARTLTLGSLAGQSGTAVNTVNVATAGQTLTFTGTFGGGPTNTFPTDAGNTGLRVTGAGVLALPAGNGFTGHVVVDGGTIQVAGQGNADPTSLGAGQKTLTLTNGGRLLVNSGGFDPSGSTKRVVIGANGGTIEVNSTTPADLNDANQFSGTGVLTKAGTGTLRIENQGYTGYDGTDVFITGGILQNDNASSLGDATPVTGKALVHLAAAPTFTAQWNLRGNGAVAFNHPVVMDSDGTIEVNADTGGSNNTHTLTTLSIGAETLTVAGGNNYQLAFSGAATLDGNPTFNTTTANLTLASINAGTASPARTINKSGGRALVVTGAGTNFAGTTTVNITGAGPLYVRTPAALGTAVAYDASGGTGGVVQNGAPNAGDTYAIPAGGILGGNLAFANNLTVGGNLSLAGAPSVIVATEAGAAAALAAKAGPAPATPTMLYAVGADLTGESIAVGPGAYFRGIATDYVNGARALNGTTTLTANGSFPIESLSSSNLTFGATNVSLTNGPAIAYVNVAGAGPAARILLSSATSNYPAGLTFTVASGSGIQFNTTTSMGNNASGALNARAVFYPGATADPGPAGSMSGNVTLLSGATLTLNDANNLGGTGVLSLEPGVVVSLVTNATSLNNSNAAQSLASQPAGVLHRLEIDNVAGLGTTNTNPAGNYQAQAATRAATLTLSADPNVRAGFVSGMLSNDNAARTVTGAVTIGAGGGTLAATTGGTFTVAAPITVSAGGGRSITVGTTRVVDAATNSDVRNGTVLLTGANDYGTGADALAQLSLVGRATLQGTAAGNGNLPQGTGLAVTNGGVYQVNGGSGAGVQTVQLGAVTPQGGVFNLVRNATTPDRLAINLNAPISRGDTFGVGNRGGLTVQTDAAQTIGVNDRVTFASAAHVPAKLTVTPTGGSATPLDMLPAWLVARSGNVGTFVTAPAGAETTTGLTPVTYNATALPASGTANANIVNLTATTTVTGTVEVAAVRTSAAINGGTLRLSTGGLLVHNQGTAFTASTGLNFTGVEGLIVNLSGSLQTFSGVVTAPDGYTKLGSNSVAMSNATSNVSGGITIAEGNLRPGTTNGLGTNGVLNILSAGVLDLNNNSQEVRGLIGSGLVNNQSSTTATRTLTINAANANDLFDFTGTIRTAGANQPVALTKTGPGTQVLSGTLGHTGATAVNGGTLLVHGLSTAVSAYAVNTGGTLGGAGIIAGPATVNSGGTLAPGASPAKLRTGSLTIASGGNFEVELNGTAVGDGITGYDQAEVIGTVALTGANLVPSLAYTPAVGDKLYIINNDGLDPVTGTFAGLAEGDTTSIGGVVFAISYTGEFYGAAGPGIGNDVVLIAQTPEPASLGVLAVASLGLLGRRRRA